jgi:hypothetical protein
MSMRQGSFALGMLLAAGLMIPAAPAEKSAVDKSVDNAVAFLQRTQETSGAWRGGPRNPQNAAITSLSVMAFLSAGHVPGEGRYGKTVEKGIEWVLRQQRPNGLLASEGGSYEMYHHGISTLMLAEAAGMTNSKLGDEIRLKLESAVEMILKAQRSSSRYGQGGWRYHVDPQLDYPQSTDLSVTGWQLMALRASRNLGCDVPAERIDWAVDYIKRCRDDATGGFRYDPGKLVTLGCTGTGILALELCGKERHRTPEALKAGSYLIKNPPRWGQSHFFYNVYYGSQATFQLGGNYWSIYRPDLYKVLLDNQNPNGSWLGADGASSIYGANYCTAMGVLALTVEYRLLPIYQRGDDVIEP